MYTSKVPTSHVRVCHVIDRLADPAIRTINWRKPVYEAIDELRGMSAPADQIDTAQRLSIALLKLEWAVQKGDADKEEQARAQLAALGEAWRGMAEAVPVEDDDAIDSREVGSVTEALERINQRY